MIAQIADREQCAHLSAKVQPVQTEFLLSADSLPYEKLSGSGFERLCYLLLLTRGHAPLFFGNSGQAQRGIDLLVEEYGERVIYQCKNVKNFSPPDMIAALKKFELEWLQQTDLPKPKKFVLCLTRSLRDVKDLEPWEKYREEFSRKHQIKVGTAWDRNYLNETLKRLPDIVAEVFSDQIAELFCERDDWDFDEFHPLADNATEPSLKRYFARKITDRLYLAPEQLAGFSEKLERNGSVLIKGLPGSGKTITSLALTEELNRYRVYYLSLRDAITTDLLVKGIKDRLSRPTIFVLDDCQGKFAQLDGLMIRVRRLLQGRLLNQALFVFLTRTTPTPGELARGDEITGFEEELKQSDAVLKFAPDQQTFRQIIEQSKPEFANLTVERLANLYEFTGHDLFLLDQWLDTLHDPEELDDLSLEFLFRRTIVRYFGSDAVDRPGFIHLAALAQFDLAPRTAGFPYNLKAEDPRATVELVAQAGHPLRYFFLHSSAAELIFRALARSHGITDHDREAADHLIAFFKDRTPDDPALADDLSKAVRNRLKLVDETQDDRLKSAFLADDAINELIERNFATLPLNLFASCLIVLNNSDSPMLERYLELIHAKIEDGTVLKSAATSPFWESNLFLWLLKRTFEPLFTVLSRQIADSGHRSLLRTTDFRDYLRLLATIAQSERDVWFESLNLIPDEEIEAMFERTITAGRSIGTLHWALRELKQNDEVLLRRLEMQIGAPRFLRLIAANGTIFELFKLIENSTLTLAEEMIAALDDKLLEQLVVQTIIAGRSIGTLHLALRELKQKDEALLRRLEVRIGAPRFLRLIAANGTIFELFKVIEYSTLALAEEMIAALDEHLVEQLIGQTITARRSIGTLNLAIRELKQNDEALLRQLEMQISAPRFLRLIAANGTVFELFMVIKCSTLTLAEELIAALDDKLVEQLIAQTIAAGRSIGTLSLALRELKESDEALLSRLEAKIGAARFLRLIAANGTIFELFRVIQHSTLGLAEKLVAALDDKLVEQLIAQTITAGRSIGTLHLTLRYLKRTNGALLRGLEEKVGIDRWWRLICSFGSIAILSELLPSMDRSFQHKFVKAAKTLSAEEWKELLRKNGFYELCYLVKNWPWFFSGNFRPDFLKPDVVSWIQSSTWALRNTGWVHLSNAPDSVGKRFLLKLLDEEFRGTQLGVLDSLSFGEAAHAVNLLWRLLPTKRNELAEVLPRFINTGKAIYSDPTYMRSVRLLFATLTTPEARPTEARIVLNLGNDATVAKPCAKATTLDLFLYLWNLYALWFEWKSPHEKSFDDFLNAELRNALITSFTVRFRAKPDMEGADSLIMLAGAMSFLGVSCDRSSAVEEFLSKIPSEDEMIFGLAPRRPFIPSVFFLLGLEWIFQDERAVPAVVWREQLVKANKYPETSAALEHLKSLVTTKSRLA